MKPTSPELLALLKSRQFYVADLYTFTLANGAGTLRYCSGDRDVTWNGILYPCTGQTGPFFDRTDNKAKCHWKIGTDVDQLVFDVLPGNAQLFGVPFLVAVRNQVFRGATMTLDRAFMATYGNTSVGTVFMFGGRISKVEAGRSIATFTVNSWLDLLNQQFPRNLYQYNCVNNLGDGTCGVNLASYTTTGVAAAAGSTPAVISANVSNPTTGYYDTGVVTFTSGALAGLSRSVRQCVFGSPGSIVLLAPFPGAPAVGDTFNISAGCDKTYAGPNGCAKFANQNRYRGFNFIPQPTTAV
jgi:uncharacterized phage protein (TIGR02218 family)